MKARDRQTGLFKKVFVKALDSLPVGSEIDFDGTSADIPVGWEQVSEKVQILWTNPNPTSNFDAQTITLNSSDYDCYEIIYSENNLNDTQFSTGKILKGKSTSLKTNGGYGGAYITSYFRITTYVDDITLHFDLPYNYTQNMGTTSYDRNDTILIPQYVIGYKTGLFS